MSISAVAQPFAELSTEVAQLSFGGDPFSAIAADERLQPLARIARGAAEQEAGHAADRCHLPEIQTELRDRMDRLHARARNPLPVPPSTEVAGLQAPRRNVMPYAHPRHVQAARVDASGAREELR